MSADAPFAGPTIGRAAIAGVEYVRGADQGPTTPSGPLARILQDTVCPASPACGFAGDESTSIVVGGIAPAGSNSTA
jgi:hypothetical protein